MSATNERRFEALAAQWLPSHEQHTAFEVQQDQVLNSTYQSSLQMKHSVYDCRQKYSRTSGTLISGRRRSITTKLQLVKLRTEPTGILLCIAAGRTLGTQIN